MREWGGDWNTRRWEWRHEAQPCQENCAQVPRGPTVPILGVKHMSTKRDLHKSTHSSLTLNSPQMERWTQRTIPKRMDHKLYIQTMKCSKQQRKEPTANTPSSVGEPCCAGGRRPHCVCTAPSHLCGARRSRLTREKSGCLCVRHVRSDESLHVLRISCIYFGVGASDPIQVNGTEHIWNIETQHLIWLLYINFKSIKRTNIKTQNH